MANYAHAKEIIAANVYTNHDGQVTAEKAKTAINEVVDTLIAGGYLYAGIAHPDDPAVYPAPDANVFYIATEPGTYTNFVGAGGSLVVADGEVAIFKFNGTWSKEVTGAATSAQVSELGQEVGDLAAGDAEFDYVQRLVKDFGISELGIQNSNANRSFFIFKIAEDSSNIKVTTDVAVVSWNYYSDYPDVINGSNFMSPRVVSNVTAQSVRTGAKYCAVVLNTQNGYPSYIYCEQEGNYANQKNLTELGQEQTTAIVKISGKTALTGESHSGYIASAPIGGQITLGSFGGHKAYLNIPANVIVGVDMSAVSGENSYWFAQTDANGVVIDSFRSADVPNGRVFQPKPFITNYYVSYLQNAVTVYSAFLDVATEIKNIKTDVNNLFVAIGKTTLTGERHSGFVSAAPIGGQVSFGSFGAHNEYLNIPANVIVGVDMSATSGEQSYYFAQTDANGIVIDSFRSGDVPNGRVFQPQPFITNYYVSVLPSGATTYEISVKESVRALNEEISKTNVRIDNLTDTFVISLDKVKLSGERHSGYVSAAPIGGQVSFGSFGAHVEILNVQPNKIVGVDISAAPAETAYFFAQTDANGVVIDSFTSGTTPNGRYFKPKSFVTNYYFSVGLSNPVVPYYSGVKTGLPFDGKVFGIDGDSITAGDQWSKYMIDKIGGSQYNVAVGWAIWSYKKMRNVADDNDIVPQHFTDPDFAGFGGGDDLSTDTNRQKFVNNNACTHIEKFIELVSLGTYQTPDVFVFALGTNADAGYGNSNGTVNQAMEAASISDQDFVDGDGKSLKYTMCGAMRWCIETIKRQYPNCRVFISLPIQRAQYSSNRDYLYNKNQLIEAMAKQMGCQTIDQYSGCGITSAIESDASPYGPYLVDGLHPNTEGQKMMGAFAASQMLAKYF